MVKAGKPLQHDAGDADSGNADGQPDGDEDIADGADATDGS